MSLDDPLPKQGDDIRRSVAELQQVTQQAAAARAELAEVKADLDRAQEAIDRRRPQMREPEIDADAAAIAKQQQKTLADLEMKRAELEKAARAAEERIEKARQELEGVERERLAAAARAGVGQGLGRGRGLDMKVAADPRRVRSPSFPGVVPNAAAVAAAAAAGQRGGGGGIRGQLPGSTVAGDFLRGEAALVEAQGQYALDSSAALINLQTARAMALDNRIRTVETFFEARRLNRVNRAFEAGPAITSDQAVQLAAINLPPRPNSVQLDPVTAAISWPRLLTDAAYQDLTTRIQKHFRARLDTGGSFDLAAANDCTAAFDTLEARLRANVDRYPTGQYGRARTFLDGLRREYDLPLDD